MKNTSGILKKKGGLILKADSSTLGTVAYKKDF